MPSQKDDRGFSHVDDRGQVSMVDVGAKQVTRREAVASGIVRMQSSTLDLLSRQALPKGDVLATARVAGILAAKQTSALIPLTHPVAISHVDIAFDVDTPAGTIRITATVRCEARTGVEIEAMTAVAVAALTVYDMCKSVEKGITIESIMLTRKSGGKSGLYERS